jgi:signal peptidase I
MVPSYTEWFALPYKRLPGLRNVERYDAVVFNFPHGDTIVVDPQWAGHDYYGILRMEAIKRAGGDVQAYANDPAPYNNQARAALEQRFGIRGRPLDKTENYVKRCVALPGETISAVDGQLFIDGEALEPPAGVQFEYKVVFPSPMERRRAHQGLGLTEIDGPRDNRSLEVIWALTENERIQLENSGMASSIERVDLSHRRGRLELFPNAYLPEFNEWDPDNFGPVTLPKRGMTVALNERNLAMYRRAIRTYEGHELEEVGGRILIDGTPADSYTFELDYYWMMGDNRHRSADSRMWGFVPETHIVGRASFVWFSKQNAAQHGENRIRWERMFKSVK